MKENHVIIFALIVIAIVVVAVGVTFANQGKEDSAYSLTVGDFLTYEESSNSTSRTSNITFEILAVNSTNVYLKQTDEFGTRYQNTTKNLTFFALDINQHPSYYNLTDSGKQEIGLKWGVKSTDFYHFNSTFMFLDIWMYHGIIVKMVWATDSLTITDVLVDTNISQIRGN